MLKSIFTIPAFSAVVFIFNLSSASADVRCESAGAADTPVLVIKTTGNAFRETETIQMFGGPIPAGTAMGFAQEQLLWNDEVASTGRLQVLFRKPLNVRNQAGEVIHQQLSVEITTERFEKKAGAKEALADATAVLEIRRIVDGKIEKKSGSVRMVCETADAVPAPKEVE